MRGQGLSGRLYREHRSCREVLRMEALHINAIWVGGIQWTREVFITSSIKQASCMGDGKHYRCFEAGPSSMDPPSCSEWHLFLIQCSVGYWLLMGAAVLTTHSMDQLSEAFMCKRILLKFYLDIISLIFTVFKLWCPAHLFPYTPRTMNDDNTIV